MNAVIIFSMRLNILNRKLHYWISILIALPLLIIIISGLLLQLKKNWSWIQPPEYRGTGSSPAIDFESILASVRGIPELGVSSWDDINRLDVRPARGMVKVWLKNGWEAQVDLGTGRVLHSAYRRSDLIESIHDGSLFAGNLSKLGLFFPTGIALFLLLVTGLWLFWQPITVNKKRKKVLANREPVL